jgi:hypothetical protein
LSRYLNSNKFELISEQTEGIFESKAFKDFRFRVEWLWEMEPPTINALKELNLF